MLKMRPFMLFGLNLVFLLASLAASFSPYADEYLFLFMVPIVYVLMPFTMSLRQAVAATFVNVGFLVFYVLNGALNTLDVAVLATLFVLVGGISYLAQVLHTGFSKIFRRERTIAKRKYNSIVAELETIDKRGDKIETELSRISRLYEITKRLASALTFDELAQSLFDFIEENFSISAVHLMIRSGEDCVRCISRKIEQGDDHKCTPDIDCQKLIACCAEHDMSSFFLTKEEAGVKLTDMNIASETLMLFPVSAGAESGAVLAIEGASRSTYGRFRILIPQIALEFRKVQLYEKVQELSIMDGLTEVYLRRYLMERIEEEVDRSERLGLTFSVGMVDVDHFKDCNDRYGHLVGDAVLNKIAEKLKNSVREVDMIARYGGEEFCVVLPETDRELATSVGERIRKSVEKAPIKAFDEELNVTVSVGIATYPSDASSINALLEKADTALYKAKRRGRNMVCTV